MKYITPTQLQNADLGLPELGMPGTAGTISTMSLSRYITRAESLIDAYCGFSMLQGGGFEPHVIGIYQQNFDYEQRRVQLPSSPVPVRRVIRFDIQISNSSPSGQPLVATLSPMDCIIDEYNQAIFVVPLTAVTYAVAPVIAQLGLTNPIARVDVEVGYFLPYLGETLLDTGDHKTFIASRGFWASSYDQALHAQPVTLPPVPPNVYVNGILQGQLNGYTVNYTEGEIIFSASQSGNTITCDYTATIPQNVADACVAQVEYFIGQRRLNQLGMTGVELVRNGDQQVRRHLRSAGGNNALDTEEMAPRAQRLLAAYRSIPIA